MQFRPALDRRTENIRIQFPWIPADRTIFHEVATIERKRSLESDGGPNGGGLERSIRLLRDACNFAWERSGVVFANLLPITLKVISRRLRHEHWARMSVNGADHHELWRDAQLQLDQLPRLRHYRLWNGDQIEADHRSLNAVVLEHERFRVKVVVDAGRSAVLVIPAKAAPKGGLITVCAAPT